MYTLNDIEKKQNIKYQEEYKRLYQSDFKEFNNRLKFHVNDDVFRIYKFLSVTDNNGLLDEFYDFWGYDIVPIVETDYEDYICLYYRENRGNPSIIYWNYELAIENSTEGITFLYSSLHEFITNIIKL